MIYQMLRPMIFRLLRDAEDAHTLALRLMEQAGNSVWLMEVLAQCYQVNDERLEQEVFGLKFPNPVGLAAGFSKDGDGANALIALGFGSIMFGTVPFFAQAGNHKPRLFRLPKKPRSQKFDGLQQQRRASFCRGTGKAGQTLDPRRREHWRKQGRYARR